MSGHSQHESGPSPPPQREQICRACHSNIEIGAAVCPHCSTHQAVWKALLLFWSSATGVIVVVISLLVSAVASFPVARKVIKWRDSVQVLSFESADGIIVTNDGDGEIFLSIVSVEVRAENGSVVTRSFPVQRSIQAGQIASASFRDEPKRKVGEFRHLANPLPKYTSALLVRAMDPADMCFDFDLFLKDDPSLQHIVTFYQREYDVATFTFPARAWVDYYSTKTHQLIPFEFPVVGTLLINAAEPSCEQVDNASRKAEAGKLPTDGLLQGAECDIIPFDGSGTKHGHVTCEPCPPGEPI